MCTPSSTPQSACAPYRCCPLLSRFEYMDHRTCPGMSSAGSFSPSKLPFHSWASGPPSNTQLLGPMHRSPHPNGISIGSAVFARLAIVTDRQTDRPRYSVCGNRRHLASSAMRQQTDLEVPLGATVELRTVIRHHCFLSLHV